MVSLFALPSSCGKSLWKILWLQAQHVDWLHGNKLYDDTDMLKNTHVLVIIGRQLNLLFIMCLYDIL